jgi:uncharacterized protein (TIGR02147 family)
VTISALLDVFSYESYRQLLGDYYARKKETQPSFSYRAFARRTGFRAPNHLKRVIEGERSLSRESGQKYAAAMGLDVEEQEYFLTLVEREHAPSPEEEAKLTERVLALRRYRSARRLDEAYVEYHRHWFIPAIFEMIGCKGFCPDPRWIAPRMRPPISEMEAARALAALKDMHLVEEKDGCLIPTDPILTTGAEARRQSIADYHRVMIESAKASIDLIPSEERDISALTLCVTEGKLQLIKERIQAFRKELLSFTAETTDGEQVVQLNMQLFPLTKRCK